MKDGFSLAELSLVTFILGILLVLSSFGYTSWASRSKVVKCASNLRDFGVALHMYAADHQQFLPELSIADSLTWDFKPYLGQYLKDINSLACPANKPGPLGGRSPSYYLNEQGLDLSTVKEPVPIMFEIAFFHVIDGKSARNVLYDDGHIEIKKL